MSQLFRARAVEAASPGLLGDVLRARVPGMVPVIATCLLLAVVVFLLGRSVQIPKPASPATLERNTETLPQVQCISRSAGKEAAAAATGKHPSVASAIHGAQVYEPASADHTDPLRCRTAEKSESLLDWIGSSVLHKAS